MVNTLIVPQLLYLGNVIYMPKQYIEQYQKIITKFIWNDKPPKIKYSAMINSIGNGGMNLQDIECKNKSLKLKWIKNLINIEYESPWKSYLNTKFQENIAEVAYFNYTGNMYPKFEDQLYNEMFNVWASIHYADPKGNEEICRQSLWNNANIQIVNRCVSNKYWRNHKIEYIQDIVGNDGEILKKKRSTNQI